MAIKVGTENKRNVIIAVVLFCVLAYLAISQLMSGPSTPAPVASRPAPARTTTATPSTAASSSTGSSGTVTVTAAPAARKATVAGPGLGIDPALHLEKLASSESIEYAGTGRNI